MYSTPMDHPQLPTHPTSHLNASSQQIQCPHSEVQTMQWSEHLFEYNYCLGKKQWAKTCSKTLSVKFIGNQCCKVISEIPSFTNDSKSTGYRELLDTAMEKTGQVGKTIYLWYRGAEVCHWTLFCSYFLSIFDPTSSLSLPQPFPFMFIFLMILSFYVSFMLTNRQQEHIWLYNWSLTNSIYLATNILKQSCSSSLTWSCAGTLSANLACSHNSKSQTSWTWSTSKSVSTARSPLLIARFLVSTTARLPWPIASIWWTTVELGCLKVVNPMSSVVFISFWIVFKDLWILRKLSLGFFNPPKGGKIFLLND